MIAKTKVREIVCTIVVFAMVVTLVSFIPSKEVQAKGSISPEQSVGTILVYEKNASGQEVLLSQLDVADMVDYMNDNMSELGRVHNYSIIDNFPTPVHQEAQGFYIYDLLDYAVENSTSDEIRAQEGRFDSNEDTVFFATFDSGGRYSEEWTYEDLYGTPRFNFPKLYQYWNYDFKYGQDESLRYTDFDQIWNNREDEEVLLSITAFSQRYIQTDEKKNAEDYDMENYWDIRGYLDTLKTMRLMLPMTEEEVRNATATAMNSRYGINNILFDLEEPMDIEAEEVEKPTWEVIDGETEDDLDDNYYYVRLSCTTEGATIYYDPLLNGSTSPTKKYTDGEALQVCMKTEDWKPFRIRAVKDGCADVGEVTVTKPSEDEEPTDAIEGASVWDGETYDTSWYDGHEDEEAYELTSAAQLAGFAWLVNGKGLSEKTINDFSGKTITLKTDVDLANKPWDPIGRDMAAYSTFYNRLDWGSYYQFSGTFDGNEHTVYRMKMNQEALRGAYQGFFGKLVSATVKNLTVDGEVQAPGAAYCSGGIAGYIETDAEDVNDEDPDKGRTYIINCCNKAFINSNPAGGIVGSMDGKVTIENCTNAGVINGCSSPAGAGGGITKGVGALGGIAGRANGLSGQGKIIDCVNRGEVYNGTVMGGIIGQASLYTEVSGCSNEAVINGQEIVETSKTMGGISAENGMISDCENKGEIRTVWLGDIGGINGNDATSITNCINRGEIIVDLPSAEMGQTAAGGIAGCDAKDIVDCVNYGALTLENGYALMGGIMGTGDKGNGASCTGCLNLGEVTAKGEAEGYISGIVYDKVSLFVSNTHSCMNMGLLTTFSKEAALIYFLDGKETISYCLDVSKKALFGSEYTYHGQPEYEGNYYLEDGVQFASDPEEKKEGISEMTLEEMRDPAFADALGERYTAAPGSYPLLKKYVCNVDIETEEGVTLAVRDVFGNEILGDGNGTYTLYEGGTYSYEASREGYVTEKKVFKPEKDQQITVSLQQFEAEEIGDVTYTGKELKPGMTITYGQGEDKKTLTEGEDYILDYQNNVNAGTATVTARGTGNYAGGIAQKTFKIKPAKLSSVSLSKTSIVYNGKARTQTLTVKAKTGAGLKTIKKGTDYTVSYKNNKNVGTATVAVKAKGNYTGTISRSFKILPKTTSLKKVKAGKKAFTATWKKQTTQTSGYQIQYSTNKKFKSGNKTVTVSKNKTTSKQVKKLKAKKKYYVRIRTFKKVGGKNYYSAWSKTKTVKTKK